MLSSKLLVLNIYPKNVWRSLKLHNTHLVIEEGVAWRIRLRHQVRLAQAAMCLRLHQILQLRLISPDGLFLRLVDLNKKLKDQTKIKHSTQDLLLVPNAIPKIEALLKPLLELRAETTQPDLALSKTWCKEARRSNCIIQDSDEIKQVITFLGIFSRTFRMFYSS